MGRLEKLPPKLDVLYEETMKRIEAQDEERAALSKLVLTWVVHSFRPLTIEDLQYAVASDPQIDWADEANLVPESLLIAVCCGLITVEDNFEWKLAYSERIVRLVHYTALDALRRLWDLTTSRHTAASRKHVSSGSFIAVSQAVGTQTSLSFLCKSVTQPSLDVRSCFMPTKRGISTQKRPPLILRNLVFHSHHQFSTSWRNAHPLGHPLNPQSVQMCVAGCYDCVRPVAHREPFTWLNRW